VPASPITASTRYFRPGTTKVNFLTTVANQASPTRAEINAGTDLSPEVASVEGWQITSEFIDTPDLASRFTSKIAGRITADDSSINFYASSNSVDVRSLLPRDTTGYILWLDEGDVSGRKMDVYKVTVASAPKLRAMEDPAQIQVQFTITAQPSENVTIPA
jgi:hypothetical protein